MKSLSVKEALNNCAEIGYDGVELALLAGWPSETKRLSRSDRIEIRQQLVGKGLQLPALLEHLDCYKGAANHCQNVEKLKAAAELGHTLSPQRPPVVQSIVGGKIAQWDATKDRLAEQLTDWARVGEKTNTVVCFKPHAAHAVNTPQRALWLHRQVGSKWLKVDYDYSHFYLERLSLAESLKRLLPITAYVQIKDSRGTPEDHRYLLPGDGKTDYLELLTLLKDADFGGFVNVEVSSHIHRQPGYQPIATARRCYERIAPLFDAAGVQRPS